MKKALDRQLRPHDMKLSVKGLLHSLSDESVANEGVANEEVANDRAADGLAENLSALALSPPTPTTSRRSR
jgi:hypothetical protein